MRECPPGALKNSTISRGIRPAGGILEPARHRGARYTYVSVRPSFVSRICPLRRLQEPALEPRRVGFHGELVEHHIGVLVLVADRLVAHMICVRCRVSVRLSSLRA